MPSGRTVEIRFTGSTRDLEAALARAGLVADEAGKKIGNSFNAGTDRAASGLHRLSAAGASWGLPFMGSLDQVGKKLDEAHTKTEKFSTALAAAGKVTLAAGTVGFAGAAAEAVKLGADFQKTTATIQANADITAKAAKQVGDAFLNTAGKSIFSAQELAGAYSQVAGQLKITEGHALTSAQAMRVMSAASDLAEASHEKLDVSTLALSATMQAYHLNLKHAVGASDTFFNVSRAMHLPIEAVAAGLARLHGRLGDLAPTLRDTSALMLELGQHGITGTRGVQVVNTAMQTLVGTSKNTHAVLKDLGVSIFDANGKFVGLQSVIQQLQPKLAGLTQQQQLFVEQTLFGKSAAQLMGQVIQEGVPKFNQASAAAGKLGTTQAASAAQSKTLQRQVDVLKATVVDLGTKFGLYLIPKLEATGQAISSVIGWMEKHKAVAEALAITIGGVLGLAVTVFAYTKAVAFVSATSNMIGGLGRLAGRVVSTGASFLGLGGEAGAAAAATVETETATMAGAVTTADDEIIASNRAAGASFTALLGPIGLAVGAAVGAAAILNKPIQTPSGGLHFATAADAKRYLSSHGAPSFAIPQLVQQLQQRGDIGGAANLGTGAGSVGAQGIPPAIGGWSGGNVPIPSGGSNAQRIAGALSAQGFSKVAIAGILGNFAQENGGQTLSGISTAAGPGGIGIAQWIGSRATEEQDYAATHHESSTSLAAQVGFLVQELRTTKRGAYSAIQSAKTPQQAALLFEQLFEGAGIPNNPARERLAAEAYGTLGGGSGSSNSGLAGLMNGITSGKTSSGSRKSVSHTIRELLYGNPLPGMTSVGRTDQGVDYTATAGSAVNAIGAGRIVDVIANWFKGQPLVEEQLTQGPDKGKFVYYAEQLNALVKQGQSVRAGQRIGTVAASGTGLELGFGAPGGRTLAAATTGYHEGQVTPAGQAFLAFMKSIGARGVYQTVNTKTGQITGGGSNIGYTIGQLEQAFTAALVKAGNSLLTKLSNAVQSGTVKSLSAALGFSSGGLASPGGKSGQWALSTVSMSAALNAAIEHLGGSASTSQINKATGGLIAQGAAGSTQDKAFQSQVLNLIADGQVKLAQRLVAAHKAAMQALGQEEYAQQTLKDGETLNLQATHLTDQTTAITNSAQDQLNVTKAQYQLTNDIAQAQLTAIRDMTQTVTDQFAGMVQSVEDHTQLMADAANAVVSGISDNTQVQVDLLGERGLYGLNLVAQKLQVGLDQQKASDDRAIAVAQQNLDQVTATEHQLVSNAQINLDQVTAAEDQLAALAQQRSDTVAINQAIVLSRAQAAVDSNTLHEDVSVVGPAQIAVDLGATLPKAQQDVLNAQLRRAQGKAGVSEGNFALWFAGVQNSVNAITAAAQQQAQAASDAANAQIGAAQQALAAMQGAANLAIAGAQGNLTGVQNTAAITEAGLQQGVSVTQAQASTQYAGSGLVVNITGVPLNDASAIASEVGWAMRTNIPA